MPTKTCIPFHSKYSTFLNFHILLGKHIGRLGHQDPGEFPEEVKALFEKAVEYYEENMALMVEIQVYLG